jgi:hypothetical protein
MIGQNIDRAMHYKLGMDVSIYARGSHREVLEPELVWATPGRKGFAAMREAEAAGISSSQGSGKGMGKGKAKAGGMGDTGLHGAGNSGVGLPGGDYDEQEMRKLLDGLKKVQEDEKQANGVMVSFLCYTSVMFHLYARTLLPVILTSRNYLYTPHLPESQMVNFTSISFPTNHKLCR